MSSVEEFSHRHQALWLSLLMASETAQVASRGPRGRGRPSEDLQPIALAWIYIHSKLKRLSAQLFKSQISIWAREMAQQLRTLTALPGDPGLIPSTHWLLTINCNSSPRGSDSLSGLSRHKACPQCTDIQADKTPMHMKLKI